MGSEGGQGEGSLPLAPSPGPALFVKVLAPGATSLLSLVDDADFGVLQERVAAVLALSPEDFAATYQLEWEDADGDKLRLRNQLDWSQALLYHRQTGPQYPLRVVVAPLNVSERSDETPEPLTTGSGTRHSGLNDSTFISHPDSGASSTGTTDLNRMQSTDLYIGSEKISYTRGRVLGSGSFGTVYLGLHQRTGQLVAIKEVALPSGPTSRVTTGKLQALAHEIRVLERLSHPNIVRYHGMQRLPTGVAIVMEYIPGGSIASLLRQFGPFGEDLIRSYVTQTLRGLSYLHQENILHRDIKGGNILVSDKGEIRLADFGSSKALQDVVLGVSARHSIVGTVDWMAPEMITGGPVSKASDIWSLGCVILEMVYAGSPWTRNDMKVAGLGAMYYIGSNPNAVPAIPSDLLSPEACDFLRLCLQRAPADRSTSAGLLQHKWITRLGVPTEQWTPRQAAAILQYIQESVKHHTLPDLRRRSDSPAQEHCAMASEEDSEHVIEDVSVADSLPCGWDIDGRGPSGAHPHPPPAAGYGKLTKVTRRRPFPSPSGLERPDDQRMDDLLGVIPDPTHRELGLYRLLTARIQQSEAHLAQRIDFLEQLAARHLRQSRTGPEKLHNAPASADFFLSSVGLLSRACDSGSPVGNIPTFAEKAFRDLFETRGKATVDEAKPKLTRSPPSSPSPKLLRQSPSDRWRTERQQLSDALVRGLRFLLVAGQLVPWVVAGALWMWLPDDGRHP